MLVRSIGRSKPYEEVRGKDIARICLPGDIHGIEIVVDRSAVRVWIDELAESRRGIAVCEDIGQAKREYQDSERMDRREHHEENVQN